MLQADYRLISRDAVGRRSTYLKEDPATGIRTYLSFDGEGGIHVKKTQRVDATLDFNVAQANAFDGYRGKDWVCTSRVPALEWAKLTGRCGAEAGNAGEYDQNQMRKLLNDPDYRAFKTVPGRV